MVDPKQYYTHQACPGPDSRLLDSAPVIAMMLCQQEREKRKENKFSPPGQRTADCAAKIWAHQECLSFSDRISDLPR